MAGGALEAGRAGAVVDVLAAVLSRPAVDAHAVVVAVGVVAGPAILAGIGHELALIHVLCAVLTCKGPGRSVPPAPSAKLRPSPPPGSLPDFLQPRQPESAFPLHPWHLGALAWLLRVHAHLWAGPASCWPESLCPGQQAGLKLGTRLWPGQPRARLQMAHTDGLVPPTSVLLQGAGGPQTLVGVQSAAGHSILPAPDLSSLLPAPHGDRLQRQRCLPEPPAARTCPLRGAAAVVGVHAVHTGASVLAAVPRTVINVLLAVLASEACSRGQPPGQASSRGQARTRPVTLALGSGTFLAGPRTPCSGRRAALHGLSCDAHRLGALGVPAPHPALPTPVTGPHTPEPTVSTFLSNRFVKGRLNRQGPTITGSPGFCRRKCLCYGLCDWALAAGPALCSGLSAHPHVRPRIPHLTGQHWAWEPLCRELEQGDGPRQAVGGGGVRAGAAPTLSSSRGAGRVGAPHPLPARPTSTHHLHIQPVSY